MSVNVVVMPSGPKATPEAVERWKAAAQRAADEHDSEVELIGRRPDGTVESHIIATPDRRCYYEGCVAPGGYNNPEDPKGVPLIFEGDDPEPDAVRDYNGAALPRRSS